MNALLARLPLGVSVLALVVALAFGVLDLPGATPTSLSIVLAAQAVPLVIMLTKGKESPFVRRHAVESLNFQISVLIYAAVSAVLVLVLIGIALLLALAVFYVVVVVLATVKAANGQEYRYPLTLRLVS